MFTFAVANAAVFVTDVAVMTTGPTAVGGGKYMVAVPLGVVPGLNEPQVLAELPGVQLHVTPAFRESPETVAVTGTEAAPGVKIPGGGWLMLTSMKLLELPHPAAYVTTSPSKTTQRDLRFIAALPLTQLRRMH